MVETISLFLAYAASFVAAHFAAKLHPVLGVMGFISNLVVGVGVVILAELNPAFVVLVAALMFVSMFVSSKIRHGLWRK